MRRKEERSRVGYARVRLTVGKARNVATNGLQWMNENESVCATLN